MFPNTGFYCFNARTFVLFSMPSTPICGLRAAEGAEVRAALYWGDAESAKLCRRVLQEIAGPQAELVLSQTALPSSVVVIHSWDLAPGDQRCSGRSACSEPCLP